MTGDNSQTVQDVLRAVDRFDEALRTRNLAQAESVWALEREDVLIIGSAPGELFFGPNAVRACLGALTSRSTAHGWHWVERRVSISGSVAWLWAEAPWLTIHDDGTSSERPYRVTGVLVRTAEGWRWCQYHGSEPIGTTG